VVIDSAAELAGLAPLANGMTTWIGTTDRVLEGTWRQVTGPVAMVLPWAVGSGMTGGEDCVADPVANEFADTSCQASKARICECDGIAVDPSSL